MSFTFVRPSRLRSAAIGCAAVASVALLGGCRPEICDRMVACCDQLEGRQEVGEICGERARRVDEAQTCRTVLETVRYMYDRRESDPPDVCLSEETSA